MEPSGGDLHTHPDDGTQSHPQPYVDPRQDTRPSAPPGFDTGHMSHPGQAFENWELDNNLPAVPPKYQVPVHSQSHEPQHSLPGDVNSRGFERFETRPADLSSSDQQLSQSGQYFQGDNSRYSDTPSQYNAGSQYRQDPSHFEERTAQSNAWTSQSQSQPPSQSHYSHRNPAHENQEFPVLGQETQQGNSRVTDQGNQSWSGSSYQEQTATTPSSNSDTRQQNHPRPSPQGESRNKRQSRSRVQGGWAPSQPDERAGPSRRRSHQNYGEEGGSDRTGRRGQNSDSNQRQPGNKRSLDDGMHGGKGRGQRYSPRGGANQQGGNYRGSEGRGHRQESHDKQRGGGRGGRRSGSDWCDMPPEERLSRNLTSVLRHRGEDMGFNMLEGGFIMVDDLLRHDMFQSCSLEQIQDVVYNNDKQRFHIESADGKWMIRANQGHTMENVKVDMTPITPENVGRFSNVIHGTYWKVLNPIRKHGLSRMTRQHIHFAMGEPGQNQVISGMRGSCEIIIHIDIRKAVEDGIEFFVSKNNVILTPGNKDGYVPPKYFTKIINRDTREQLKMS